MVKTHELPSLISDTIIPPSPQNVYYLGIAPKYDRTQGISELQSPQNDVRALKCLFEDTIPGMHTRIIEGTNATAEEIRDALKDLKKTINSNADEDASEQERSAAVIHFCGHGLENYGLAAANITSAKNKDTECAISHSELRNIIKDCKAKIILIILDCCYAGGVEEKQMAFLRTPFNTPVPQTRSTHDPLNIFDGEGTMVWSASAPTEPAVELKEEKHGALTWAIIQTFISEDDEIDLDSALANIKKTVRQKVADTYNFDQEVSDYGNKQGSVKFPALKPGKNYTKEFPTEAQRLERIRQEKLRKERWHQRIFRNLRVGGLLSMALIFGGTSGDSYTPDPEPDKTESISEDQRILEAIRKGDFSQVHRLTQLNEETIELLLAENLHVLPLGSITHLTLDQALKLQPYNGILILNGLKEIDGELATFLAQSYAKEIRLNGLTKLSPDAAESLQVYRGSIHLDGISSEQNIPWDQLQQWDAVEVSLNGIQQITPENIQKLLSREIRKLHLNAIQQLNPQQAEVIQHWNGAIHLNGIQAMTDELAELMHSWEVSEIHLNGLKEIRQQHIQLIAQETRTIALNGIEELSKAQATVLASQRVSAYQLNGITAIDAETMLCFKEFRGALQFGGIRSIDKDTAKATQQYKGRRIELGIATLDAEVAQQLFTRGDHTTLSLNNIKSIPQEAYPYIEQYRHSIELNGMDQLTIQLARALKNCKNITLNGVVSIEPNVAAIMPEWSCLSLTLNGISSLSPQLAQQLAKADYNRLNLNGLQDIDEEVATTLGTTRIQAIHLSSLRDISPQALQNFLQNYGKIEGSPESFPVAVSLNGIRILNPEMAEAIASFHGEMLILNGIRYMSKEAGQALSALQCAYLELKGIKALDASSAEGLINFRGQKRSLGNAPGFTWQGVINLGGVESIDRNTAEKIAQYKCSEINLSGLRDITPEAAYELFQFGTEYFIESARPYLHVSSLTHQRWLPIMIARASANVTNESLEREVETAKSYNRENANTIRQAYESMQENPNTPLDPLRQDMPYLLTDISEETAEHIAYIYANKDLNLTLLAPTEEVLRIFASSSCKLITFIGLEFITPGMAEALQNFQGSLRFPEIREMTGQTARALGQLQANTLELHRLQKLTRETANGLSEFGGWELYINNIQTIDPDAAAAFEHFRCIHLHMSNLQQLSQEVAQGLVQFPGRKIVINGRIMNEDNIEPFENATSDIVLTNLTQLHVEVVQVLASNRGINTLILRGEYALNEDTAAALGSKTNGHIILDITELTEQAARGLGNFRGNQLTLNKLTELTELSAQHFIEMPVPIISLDGLTNIDIPTARVVAQWKYPVSISFKGITSFTPEVEEILKDIIHNIQLSDE